MSILSGTLGAVLQNDANRDANATNRNNVKDTNALNYQMFQESRGKGGNAILPLYMPDGTELKMANGAIQVYDAVSGQPVEMTLEEYQRMQAAMQPAVTGGNDVINSIYNGQMEARRMAALDPVLAARTNAAEANAGAVDVALQQERNRLAAADAAKGYAGTDSFAASRLLAATIAARQQAAQQRAAAVQQNASDVMGLKENMNGLQLQSLDLPIQRTNALIAYAQSPYAGLVARQQLAQRAMDWFKLNPGNPPTAQTFQAGATANPWALAASGISQAGNAAFNYWQNQQLINSMSRNLGTSAGAGAAASAATSAAANGAAADYAGELLL